MSNLSLLLKRCPHDSVQQANIKLNNMFWLFVLVYLLLGVVGHDPWKQDETYIFGIILHMFHSGDGVIPMVAGEPFMEKPPLYYWVGTGFIHLLLPWLSLHDAARCATPFFMLITCIAIKWTARFWWGEGYGRKAVLVLLGCLGLILHSHMMLTDIPLLTGVAISLCGFALMPHRYVLAGVLLGVGVGVSFLAKGVLGPGVIGVTVLLLPMLFREWRKRYYLYAVSIALLVALPWLVIWPVLLYKKSPELFMEWFWLNNIGRFLGFSVAELGAPHEPGFWLVTIPWFTFPALPLAVVTVWKQRNYCLKRGPYQVIFLLIGVFMAVLAASASARANYALPMLAPLSVLAAPALTLLPQSLHRYWDWIAKLFFGILAILVWYVWVYKMMYGVPPHWQIITKNLPSDFVEHISVIRLSVAISVSVGACLLWRWVPMRIQAYGGVSWIVGLTLFWGLVSALWIPWLDNAKSYRGVFDAMAKKMPGHYRCIESKGLGESERAMLDYVLGIDTLRQEVVPHPNCDVFLIDGLLENPPALTASKKWVLVWEGARPGDFREHFWLFRSF